MFNSLLIDEIIHGLVATPFAYLLWINTGSIERVTFLFLVTYLVDLDHLIDYFHYYGFKFDIKRFLGVDYFKKSGKAYVLFHAWEWLIVLAVLTFSFGWGSYFAVLFLGLLPHYVYDSFTVRSFKFYSIIFRVLRKFSVIS